MTDDRYVVSDERLAEIRKMIVVDDLDVIAVASVGDLAHAVYDLLCERDDASVDGSDPVVVYDPDGNAVAKIPRPQGLDLPEGTRLVFDTTPLLSPRGTFGPPLDEDGEPYDPVTAEEAHEAHLISRQETRDERREMEADERDAF